ncbi:restriction endonuclease subunit S [Chryseobacterium sp. S0630]|uniref:restriction endonuclease subunit S n=1 Tax=Chryseobacterium sp. S0630 TaxID=2957803 RepID=UPI00209FB1B7|nr:restriction endonuclease subunit S [Chryseobacterium sp. S0630]MCP1301006.1 restriction endonuclease subunit S [Chryseobacterium sp. S0630]
MIKFNKISFQKDIPDTWSRIPLYELRNKKDRYGFTGGPFGSDLKSEHYTESGIKILQLQNIGEGKFIDKGIVYTSEQKADELISCNIYPGEIILAKMAPVARCCKVPSTDERYLMCSDGIRLSVDTHKFDNEFVFQSLNSKYFRDEAESKSTGTTRARIGLNELKQICLYVPNSVQEQQKIAEILSTVDEKIEVIDQQIIQTQELKKGLMQRLLTKGIGHTEFKDSTLGMIPESWEVVELDEISSTTRLAGYEYSEYWEESIDGEITALRGYNIGKNKLLLHNVIKISEELSQKLIRSRLFKGNVVFPCVGTIGNAIVIEENDKYHINQNIAKITPNDNLDSYFLMQYLISPMCKNEIKRFNATTSQPNVLVGSLRKFRIPFPSSISEQIKISRILGSVDDKLEILSEKKTHYQELKQGLMQQLLTGKIRVKV